MRPLPAANGWSNTSSPAGGSEGTVGLIVADAAVPGVRKLLETRHIDYDMLGEDPTIFDPHADSIGLIWR